MVGCKEKKLCGVPRPKPNVLDPTLWPMSLNDVPRPHSSRALPWAPLRPGCGRTPQRGLGTEITAKTGAQCTIVSFCPEKLLSISTKSASHVSLNSLIARMSLHLFWRNVGEANYALSKLRGRAISSRWAPALTRAARPSS